MACGCSTTQQPAEQQKPTASAQVKPKPTAASRVLSPTPIHEKIRKLNSGPRLKTFPLIPARPRACAQPGLKTDQMRSVPARQSGWKLLSVDQKINDIMDVDVAADGAVWAQTVRVVDDDNEKIDIRRWHKGRWSTFERPPIGPDSVDAIYAIAAESARRTWVFGTTAPPGEDDVVSQMFIGTFEHGHWDDAVLTDEDTRELDWSTVGVASGWAKAGDLVLRWNGQAWLRQSGEPPGGQPFGQGHDMWALDGTARSVLRWQGTGWQQLKLPELGTRALDSVPEPWLTSVVPYGRDAAWVIGNVGWDMDNEEHDAEAIRARPVAVRWNGSSWTCTWGPMHRTFRDAAPDGKGGLWVIADQEYETSELWHLSGGRWTKEFLPAPAGQSFFVQKLIKRPGSDEVYAAGHVTGDDLVDGSLSEDHRGALWRTN
ncbi:hypothetical protein GCM10009850_068400 [Nonomuraea monospora]|uniref:Uncharacterized protein n=2 Tax=Nonomuraea monospora TaxID=568818 RepID=A0ABN3CQE7_9ACTN